MPASAPGLPWVVGGPSGSPAIEINTLLRPARDPAAGGTERAHVPPLSKGGRMDARSVVGQMKKMLAGGAVVGGLESRGTSGGPMGQGPAPPGIPPDARPPALGRG